MQRPAKCPKCRSPLHHTGVCVNWGCLPLAPRMGGKGSGRGNLNAVSAGRAARKSCPLCVERGCWPSVCHLGPPRPNGGRGPCDCHALLAGHAPAVRVPLNVRNFGLPPHSHGAGCGH